MSKISAPPVLVVLRNPHDYSKFRVVLVEPGVQIDVENSQQRPRPLVKRKKRRKRLRELRKLAFEITGLVCTVISAAHAVSIWAASDEDQDPAENTHEIGLELGRSPTRMPRDFRP